MRIVTFHTPQYEGERDGWWASIEDLPWRAEIFERPCRGSWRANVGMKPEVFLEILDELKESILFIDIDGRVRGKLPLFTDEWLHQYDFGAYFIPWNEMTPAHRPGGATKRNDGIASGTVYVNYTLAAIAFLMAWEKREKQQRHRYGQIVLGETWHWDRPEDLWTARLPQAYTKVFDRSWKKGESGPVEIEHMQASRRLRSKVG